MDASLDRDAGDYDSTEVSNVVPDVWHPSFNPVTLPPVSRQVSDESFLLAQESISAAKKMLAEKQGREADAEAVRAAHWNGLSLKIRIGCMKAANLPKERANDNLMKFDALERGKIHLHIMSVMRDLTIALRCMQGGHISTGAAVH